MVAGPAFRFRRPAPAPGPGLALCLLALGSLLAACAGSSATTPPTLRVEGLSFENRSGSPISQIRLEVPATGGFVSCGHIAPGNVCSSRFPGVTYGGEPVRVSWVQGGQPWSTGELRLSPGKAVRDAGAGVVRVLVLAPGSAGVQLFPVPAGDTISRP